MANLCINIDHIATIREARKGVEPDPVHAAAIAELSGVSGITVHLREDRRHIHDRDVLLLKETVHTKLNLEMSINESIVKFALNVKPDEATLVPEKREELTTEGGLDVIKNRSRLKNVVGRLKQKGIIVSLFIDAEKDQIKAAKEVGADFIEIHTGHYANATGEKKILRELKKVKEGVEYGIECGLRINAGHGLNYINTPAIAAIPGIEDLNTGHSIISRASLVGLETAIKDMLKLCS